MSKGEVVVKVEGGALPVAEKRLLLAKCQNILEARPLVFRIDLKVKLTRESEDRVRYCLKAMVFVVPLGLYFRSETEYCLSVAVRKILKVIDRHLENRECIATSAYELPSRFLMDGVLASREAVSS